MRTLSLFSGIGGFDLGLEMAGFETVAQVELDSYCQKILPHHFPGAKQYQDIRTVTGEQIKRDCGAIDVVAGGFPCQDISHAGKGAGLDGERSALWWEMHRLINELRPRWVIAENVDALRNRGIDRVVASMEELGYTVWCFGIPASALGAPHQRKRIIIVGHSKGIGSGARRGSARRSQQAPTSASDPGASVAHANSDGAQAGTITGNAESKITTTCDTSTLAHTDSDGIRDESGRCCRQDWTYSPFNFPAGPGQEQYDWEAPRTIESRMGVTANGLPRKLALRACGNALVPATAYVVGRAILRLDRIM